MRRFLSLLTLVHGYNIRWNDILYSLHIQIKQGQLIVKKKIKLLSHKDIYSIIIILQCPLQLIYEYKFIKHNSHKPPKKKECEMIRKNVLPCLG